MQAAPHAGVKVMVNIFTPGQELKKKKKIYSTTYPHLQSLKEQ